MNKYIRVLVLALAVSVLAFALVGCGGTGDSGGGTSTGGAKDTFTFAQGADPRGLDPAYVDDGESAKVMCNVYEGLTKYADDSTEIEPCLAESWEVSEDGLTYTFKLREGVKFQDDTDFNAEAVKFNIDRQVDYDKRTWEDAPYVDMPYASFTFGTVAGVTVIDPLTVEIKLTQPNTAFLANLAMTLAAPIVSPTALNNDASANVMEAPVGTGPYKFVKWNKEENVQLEAFDGYWGDKALTKNVIIRIIADNAARVLALNNGEIDMCDGVDATLVDQIKGAGDQLFEADGMNINYMAYNTTSKMFKDQAARVAFSQAVNVPELVDSLYQGYATQATTVLPTFISGYSDTVKQVAFDEAAAKAGLEKAGIKEVHMITYSNPRPYNPATGETLATAIAGYLEKVGVKCTIDKYDWTTYKDVVKKGDYDICFYGWTGDNGDPDNFLNLMSDPDPSMNVARFNDKTFNGMIKDALATDNGPERNDKYTACEAYTAERAVWMPVSHGKVLAGYKSGVEGFIFHQTGSLFCSKVVVK